MIAITTSSSTSVNPDVRREVTGDDGFKVASPEEVRQLPLE
jgi:hypothetical protein